MSISSKVQVYISKYLFLTYPRLVWSLRERVSKLAAVLSLEANVLGVTRPLAFNFGKIIYTDLIL